MNRAIRTKGKIAELLRVIGVERRAKPPSLDWKRFEILLLAIGGQLALDTYVLVTSPGTRNYGQAQSTFVLGSMACAIMVGLTLQAGPAETGRRARRALVTSPIDFVDVLAAMSVSSALLLVISVITLADASAIPRGVRVPAIVGVAMYSVFQGLRVRARRNKRRR